MPSLRRLLIVGDAESWRQAGFAVDGGGQACIGSVVIELVEPPSGRSGGDGTGITSAYFDELTHGTTTSEIDGLAIGVDLRAPTIESAARPTRSHPNGVVGLDHLVVVSPDLDRTADVFAEAGFDLRRRRDAERDGRPVSQLFYWAGDSIIEVVLDGSADPSDPSRYWGLAFTVDDLDRTVALLGELVGRPRPAVQPGRRIASLRREAGLSVPIAFMTPHLS